MSLSFDDYLRSADYIRERLSSAPEIGLILGSGLGTLAAQIEERTEIPYEQIPLFPRSTAPSHAGKLICGRIGSRYVVCMSGRFHSYEGYDCETLAVPVRVLKLLGIRTLILTNAAGAVNISYSPGDIMIIRDQMMFSGMSPMRGENLDAFGPRFFDVSKMYDPELIRIAKECAEGIPLRFHEGVYFFMQGPQFETPAEIRAIRILGGDAVGMSTVTEALTAAHCSLPVLGFSVITNMAAGVLEQPLTAEEVSETGKKVSVSFAAYMRKILERI
jgi:purine-nucleoside phosphorylase